MLLMQLKPDYNHHIVRAKSLFIDPLDIPKWRQDQTYQPPWVTK